MIGREDIDKLASLIRLSLSNEETEKMATEVDSILNYVSQINSLEVSSDIKENLTSQNVFREDSSPHESGVFTERIINQVPESELNYIKVKRII